MNSVRKKHPVISILFFLCFWVMINVNCNHHQKENKSEENTTNLPVYKKPTSGYQDSLYINEPAAVFYHPDSLQLLKIKEGMDSSVYDGTMHEFFYQIRNAKNILSKTWPGIRIIDAKNCRFLVFQKKDNSKEVIDLDQKNDAYGLFLFDQIKSPLLADMTNIETALGTYFK